ncbi:hypothetical protein KGM_210509 [Danaus plexippus plexippus]|uniref:DFDF domain-containing protein n=1 Tax=Danaus plexippus plexippus TaxID=278856 RepID=A0A212F2E0_DANPL|nr:enhancer of mRNA-decapping protein 3 [Danaus plexippus plexippus]OWR47899.1 hypothetical protein KGM_210509 [Danaus plexippus plexippus]
MSKWIGYAVSVNCGEPLGCYQGTILEADGSTITLTKAFRNGFPYPKSQVTLNSADIKDLKIIEEARTEPSEQTHSTVAVTKSAKKGQRATVCENLEANPSHPTGSQTCNKTCSSRSAPSAPRSKPIDIQGPRINRNTHSGSYGNASSTPKTRPQPGGERARRRNEACFGHDADPALGDDFDFEGNLALFDKQALWEEMRTTAATRPDVVRAADEAARYRHDENVLGSAPPADHITVPADRRGPVVYAADDGRRVPSVTLDLRRDFWLGLRRLGLLEGAQVLLARAAADLALRLAGGGRRLEPRNAHQAPVAAVLAGVHDGGVCGLVAARILAAHGVAAHAFLSGTTREPPGAAFRRELGALAAAGVARAERPDELPPADVVLLALSSPEERECQEPQDTHEAALAWARAARSACVALEPPAEGWPGVSCRASVVAGLPAALSPSLGRVYAANVAAPARLWRELGVSYRPPFGAASVLALD